MIAAIFDGYPTWVNAVFALAGTLVLSYVLAELIARGAWRLLCPLFGERAASFRAAPLLRPIRLIRVVVFLLLAATLILPAMELVGIPTVAHIKPEALIAWLVESGVRIGLILLLCYLIIRITALVLNRFEQDVAAAGGPGHIEQIKRLRTLGNLVRSTIVVIVSSVGALMILRELRLDIMPVLTAAGILGLAVGFGAQTLVKDVISGFFMILENQVRVGDVANINGTGGLVEAVTLRTIVLRDQSGTVYVFPNGSITQLANLSKDFSYYVIDLGVDYSVDTDRVVDLLTRVAAELQQEEPYRSSILEPLEIIGVDDFAASQVTLKARIKTLPLKQWEVGRELRRRIKKRFDAEGVPFPFSAMTIHIAPDEWAHMVTQSPPRHPLAAARTSSNALDGALPPNAPPPSPSGDGS